ncbi:hypothetical protein ADILRU_2470 [Leifsonia rubra CMS 76R]|nr:hypothetical protein ADILRU_2470 [Leifsonia rubra CMS 76R]
MSADSQGVLQDAVRQKLSKHNEHTLPNNWPNNGANMSADAERLQRRNYAVTRRRFDQRS